MIATLVLLFLAGIVAGCVDAIAGGSGLLMVPAFLAAGLPPGAAIATNKLCNVLGSATSVLQFGRRGLLDRSIFLKTVLPGVGAAIVGSSLMTRLDKSALEPLIAILLATITLVTILKP